MIVASFLFFLAIFVVIGGLSVLAHNKSEDDYLLASSSVKPWLVALSAVATNNSGYMFVGLIGYVYAAGIQGMWVMVGWILGDFLISFQVHKKLRQETEKRSVLSYGGALSLWGTGEEQKYLRLLIGFITLAFLGTYAAAQLGAGSKALHVLFGWDYSLGAIIGAVIVLIYCFAGGIRASIWTDAAQSFVMFFAMILMFVLAVSASGGFGSFSDQLQSVSPTYMDLFPSDLQFGALGFVLGWLVAGIGVVGQPHIMVRYMAMEDPQRMGRVRAYYYSWYTLFSALCIGTGLAARLLIPEAGDFDAELALPSLAQELLHPILVGLVLAGLFAATMSTADSQILSCSAALVRDLTMGKIRHYWLTKFTTVFVTAVALGIALYGSDSVFALVVFAWAGLACAFGPLIILLSMGQKPSEPLAALMMIGGIAGALGWQYLGYSGDLYEILPGMACGFLIFGLGKAIGLSSKIS